MLADTTDNITLQDYVAAWGAQDEMQGIYLRIADHTLPPHLVGAATMHSARFRNFILAADRVCARCTAPRPHATFGLRQAVTSIEAYRTSRPLQRFHERAEPMSEDELAAATIRSPGSDDDILDYKVAGGIYDLQRHMRRNFCKGEIVRVEVDLTIELLPRQAFTQAPPAAGVAYVSELSARRAAAASRVVRDVALPTERQLSLLV